MKTFTEKQIRKAVIEMLDSACIYVRDSKYFDEFVYLCDESERLKEYANEVILNLTEDDVD